ncbi:MAG: hypothetical protein HY649_07515 [Acidobacteria bacterium]|nr:hypothetical protein [Acidobacteriota bacterium]
MRNNNFTRGIAGGFLAVVLTLGFSLSAHAVLGGSGALGNFINPLTVGVPAVSPTEQCDYSAMKIDMNLGKVIVTPFNNATTACVTTADQEYPLTLVFSGSLPASFPDGVFEVADFTLQQPQVGARAARTVTLEFLRNADNTPVILRSNGATGVFISTGTTLNLNGKDGGDVSGTGGIVRGAGGKGGPGGYQGGDGGNGGVTPTRGMSGYGPGGALGGAVGAVAGSAKFLTVGVTLPTTANNTVTVPTSGGPDLATQLRGGSGGGGGGGKTNGESGRGGGGGGGAIVIAADNTITVNGTITARGGSPPQAACPAQRAGSPGTGGVIRLVATTIAGTGGSVTVAAGTQYNPACAGGSFGSDNGLIRLEAYNITITSTLTGPVAAASAPGLISVPGDTPTPDNPFVRFARIKHASNPNNCVSLNGSSDVPACGFFQGSQDAAGRTGSFPGVDATMPNATGVASTVNVDFIVGPIPGFPTAPTNPNITLVVAPQDPSQGAAVNYTAPISLVTDAIYCAASACKTSITNVTLPLGFSSMSAFVVLNLTGGGTLARVFPKMYEGEEIEAVRMETTGSDTTYVLIARSGREFPYLPGQ